MAWISSSPLPYDTFASLGSRHGDTYTVGEDCLRTLQEILRKLAVEDITFRTFRRAISFGQNIRKDLIPLLIYVKDDTKITDATKIIDTTIKILVNLTIPIEYLMSIEDVAQTDVGRHTIFELSQLLTSSKEAFTDSRSTKALIDHMKHVVERHSNLNIEQCDSINNCLLLLRNLLHIPEQRTPIYNCPLAHFSMQNQIIWNLFTQSIDKIIIYLISCPQKMYWGFTMVQLIALMYKDQHVGTLQKLLNLWLESSLSESSEDNESNTSPPQGSGDSSPIITSDPTSDSSDNGEKGQRNKNNTTDVVRAAQNRSKALAGMKRVKSTETETSTSSGVSLSQSTDSGISSKGTQSQSSNSDKSEQMSCTPQQQQQQNVIVITNGKKCEYPSSQSEVSDCGYVTQVENQESISTSSNDDDQPHQKPVHQKPHTFQKTRYNTGKNRSITILDKKELRRKKLVKRSKTNTINVKGLMHHLPTDEDITNILKEFTVDFLLKGYATLVHDLHSQLLSSVHVNIDTSHFFWLVTYFLKFATQLELDLEHISPVLSYNILSYLVFQGVWLYEELEIWYRVPNIDLKPCLRRLHLVVTAIREFLQTVKTYRQMTHISEEDCTSLNKLKVQICESEDLKCLFLLLLRQYNPKYQSKQYLQDLILTNHNYLLFLDNFMKTERNPGINLMEHLKQFATVEIMHQYGILLEDFKENGEFVNNCIFTMMHHIGGDLEHLPTLFQPHILKTFSLIWETDYEICDDWADLIEYVINKFINSSRPHYTNLNDNMSPIARESEDASPTKNESTEVWTKEEKDNLLNYYNQSQNTHDTIANITMKYQRNGTKTKTQLSIITELLEQNIINENQYNDFMRCRKSEKENEDSKHKMAEMKMQTTQENLIDGDIRVLKEYLFRENKGNLILWLQKVLIEACFIKLVLANPELYRNNDAIMEPTCYYYASINLPIPVVPWTTEQNNVVKHQPFILLLHKLGFYLPVDTGKIFVRIPNFWNADYIFSIAQQLGPIDPAKIKFDMKLLNGGFNKPKTEVENINETRSFSEQGKFSMTDDVKETPSVVRYTPLPDSKECYQTYLQSRLTTFLETALHISTNQLSIAIPEINSVPCDLTPPELCIAEHASVMSGLDQIPPSLPMDCSPIQETLCILNDDIEHNSICETASVASDLTRMCVSDEEDKEPLVLDEEKK